MKVKKYEYLILVSLVLLVVLSFVGKFLEETPSTIIFVIRLGLCGVIGYGSKKCHDVLKTVK